MQNRAFYAYSLASSMLHGKSDYLDCFWPLAVCSMPPSGSATVASIQKAVASKYSLNVPQHVLSVLLERAEKRGNLRYDNKHAYSLTSKGSEYVHDTSSETDITRRVNALIDDIFEFFAAHDTPIAHDVVEDMLFQFIQENLNLMLPYLSPSTPKEIDEASSDLRPAGRLLLSYVQAADRAKPVQYATLQDLVIGAVLTLLLTTPNASEIQEYRKTRIKDCTFYLDTNVAISMLGLRTNERGDPASELLSMMKAAGLQLRVFDFTVDEICYLVSGYQDKYDKYPEQIRIDDIYSELRRKNWTPEDARHFVTHVDEHLRSIGVLVEDVPTVHLETYTPQRPELVDEISKYKPQQDSKVSVNHDLAAIDQILLKRRGSRRRIETCGAIFLTSDLKLARFNLDLYEHRGTATVCEVIPDRVLATILWLKNPTGTPPMKAILATYSREMGVNRKIWNRFYEILSRLWKEGRLTEDDVSTIIYDQTIEGALSSVSAESEELIDESYVLEQARASKERELRVRDMELHERESHTVKQIALIHDESSRQASKDWARHIATQQKALRSRAGIVASRVSTSICVFLTIVVVVVSVWLWFKLRDVNLQDLWSLGLSLLANSPSVCIWTKVRPWLQQAWTRRIYDRNITVFELQDTKYTPTTEPEPESGSSTLE